MDILKDSLYRKAARAAFFSVGDRMEENKETIEQNNGDESIEMIEESADKTNETIDKSNETADRTDESSVTVDVEEESESKQPETAATESESEQEHTETSDSDSVVEQSKTDLETSEPESADAAPEIDSDAASETEQEPEKKAEPESETDSTSETEQEPAKKAESAETSEPETADAASEIDSDAESEPEQESEKKAEPIKKHKEKAKSDKAGVIERFGKRKLVIAAAAAALVILAVILIVVGKNRNGGKEDPKDTAYYTFSDVQKDVAYLANDQEQLDKLNRLIDPMKKSNPIDVNYVNSIAKIIGVDKSDYNKIIKGYKGKDKLPQTVFDEFYDAVIKTGKVEGITTKDVFLNSISGTEYGISMLSDGVDFYEADNVRLDGEAVNKIYSFYEKNGKIFRTIGPSDAEHTVSNVLLTGFAEEAKTASFMMNGEIVTLPYPDYKVIKELVVNITFTNDGIISITPSGEEINGRITAVNSTNLKINDKGFYDYDEDFKVFDNSGEEPTEADSSQFLVGYKELKIYVDDRKVKAVVITDSELDSEEIRVLINDSEYSGYQLKDVTFSCSSDYTITFSNGSSEEKTSDSKVMFTPASFGMHESVTLSCDDPDGRFTIESIERNGLNPSYRGTFEVVMMGDFLYIINKLPIEQYLYAVVSSELPDSYDDEALRAFAVVARGFACKMMESNQFSSYGADIDDSNSTLLYNYYPETDRSIKIVNETYGMVPAYEDNIIIPYHFLTSAGVTCTNTDIYDEETKPYYGANYETEKKEEVLLSSEDSFRDFIDNGSKYDILEADEPYYRWSIAYTEAEMTEAVNSVIDERIKNTVDTVLVMEKPEDDGAEGGTDSDNKTDNTGDKSENSSSGGTDSKTGDVNSSDSKTGDASGNSNKPADASGDGAGSNDKPADASGNGTGSNDGAGSGAGNSSSTGNGTGDGTDNGNADGTGDNAGVDAGKKLYIDIIENNNFIPAAEGTKLGDIQDIAVVSRSNSGVVKELLIIGTQNTIWIKGQTNVRYILNPLKLTIIKNDGTEAKGYSLMPSPFYYVEKTDNGYTVRGGGFGNGVGLSLSGAQILSQKGYTYDEIIKHYYNGVEIRNMFGLYDKDADNNQDNNQNNNPDNGQENTDN